MKLFYLCLIMLQYLIVNVVNVVAQTNQFKIVAMKKAFLIIIVLLSLNTFAQDISIGNISQKKSLSSFTPSHMIGVQGGLNLFNATSINAQYKPGVLAGLNYEYFLSEKYSVELGALYSGQGYNNEVTLYDSTGFAIQTVEARSKINYLLLPVKFGFRSGKKVFTFVKFGLVPGMLLNAETTRLRVEDNVVLIFTDNSTNGLKKFDLAGLLEAGLGVNLKNNMQLYSAVGYKHSFTTYYDGPSGFISEPKHFGYSVSVGLKYRL